MKRVILSVLAVCVVLLAVVCLSSTAHAATFSVTTTGDESAINPAISCAINGGSDCTLRSAIEAANAQAGADTITFNISGSGVHTITPGSNYPHISEQLTLDASTQPGSSCGTLVPTTIPTSSNTPHTLLIEINASNILGNNLHFVAGSDNSVVKGFVMGNNTGGSTVYAENNSGMTIECNYLGTNPSGSTIAPINSNGINLSNNVTNTTIQNNLISGANQGITGNSGGVSDTTIIQNNLIGTDVSGTSAIANIAGGIYIYNTDGWSVIHNVVAGNSGDGINITNNNNTTVSGNLVGVGLTGSALGNGGDGVAFYGTNNFTVGGVTSSLRNIISANTGDGLHIYNNCSYSSSAGSVTYGNYIGTNSSGVPQSGFGNQKAGVEVNEYQGSCGSVYQHKIGGDNTGEPNTIAGNTGQGILIHQDNNHDVFTITTIGNSIYANGQFGIDLAADSGGDGVADTDLGPNALNDFLMSYPTGLANYYINRPTITNTSFAGNQLTVGYNYQANGVADSFPNLLPSNLVGYRLDFYINDAGKDGAYDGYSQGKTHLGSFIVDGSETNATHTFTSPVTLKDGQTVTATTTVLWQIIPDPGTNCQGDIWGDGVPYTTTCVQ